MECSISSDQTRSDIKSYAVVFLSGKGQQHFSPARVFILAECKGEAYIEKAVTLIFHPWPRREVFIFTLLLAVHNCAMVLAPMRLPR